MALCSHNTGFLNHSWHRQGNKWDLTDTSFSTHSQTLKEGPRALQPLSIAVSPQPEAGAATEGNTSRQGRSRRLRARRQNYREAGAAENRQHTGTGAKSRGKRGPTAAPRRVTAARRPRHLPSPSTETLQSGTTGEPPVPPQAMPRALQLPAASAGSSGAMRGGAGLTAGGSGRRWCRRSAGAGFSSVTAGDGGTRPHTSAAPLPAQHAVSGRVGPGRRQGHHGKGAGGGAALPQGIPGGLHVRAHRGEGGAGRSGAAGPSRGCIIRMSVSNRTSNGTSSETARTQPSLAVVYRRNCEKIKFALLQVVLAFWRKFSPQSSSHAYRAWDVGELGEKNVWPGLKIKEHTRKHIWALSLCQAEALRCLLVSCMSGWAGGRLLGNRQASILPCWRKE